ncbi:MAG: triose-phosphate isomerase [Chloroflexi bacterium]|nr:triose-phosphate isomerase [Chloroflexota bacterium]
MRTPLIAGNWKMHRRISEALGLAQTLAESLSGTSSPGREVVICPPFTALLAVREVLKGSSIILGAQNLYPEPEGAYTGEISPTMLADLGCRYVILGHSERRQHLGETDEFINRKVQAALANGLRPILCVGEILEQRERGQEVGVVATQLRGCLQGVQTSQMGEVVIAYEPVWAIGTGKNATPEQAQTMHQNIRQVLQSRFGEEVANNTRILYGGSVKADNIDSLMAQPDIDGVLVGGASLDVTSFIRIVNYQPA